MCVCVDRRGSVGWVNIIVTSRLSHYIRLFCLNNSVISPAVTPYGHLWTVKYQDMEDSVLGGIVMDNNSDTMNDAIS